jgi:gas vesicle protein
MKTKNTAGKFVLGTLVGGIVGGIAALLVAPQSGSETQQLILEKKDELRQEAEKRGDEVSEFTKGKMIEARNIVSDWLAAGSELLKEKSNEIKLEKQKKAKADEKQKAPA